MCVGSMIITSIYAKENCTAHGMLYSASPAYLCYSILRNTCDHVCLLRPTAHNNEIFRKKKFFCGNKNWIEKRIFY